MRGHTPPLKPPLIVIESSGNSLRTDVRSLWEYRELLYFLVWRDVKVRYKQTVLGVAWAVLQPFLMMIVFSAFLGKLARIPSDGVAYPVFAFAALVPWTYFATAVGSGGNALVGSQHLITKVYFPRLLIPIAAVVTPLVDLAIAFMVLVVMMVGYGIAPTANILWVAPFVGLAVITAFAASLWLSALNVRYRDVRFVIPFFVQIWLFATPVAYPASLIPEPWRPLYGLNPMAGVVEGFRWTLLGTSTAPGPIVAVSLLVVIAVLAGGVAYFRGMEGRFADVV